MEAGVADQLAQTVSDQLPRQTMTCFIPMPNTQFRVAEAMEKDSVIFSIGLECWRQIQHRESCAYTEFPDSKIGIEKISHIKAALISCTPGSIWMNLRSHACGYDKKLRAMRSDVSIHRDYQFFCHGPGIFPRLVLRRLVNGVSEPQLTRCNC